MNNEAQTEEIPDSTRDLDIEHDRKLMIEDYGAGEIVPAFEVFDAVRNGTVDCGVSAPYYWISKHKAIPFFCTVPGLSLIHI